MPEPDRSYRSSLSAEDQKIYDAMSDTIDLSHEIRLLRTVVVCAMKGNDAPGLARFMPLLLRAVTFQARRPDPTIDGLALAADAAEKMFAREGVP